MQDLIDPVSELANPGVDAGLIWFGATDTPGNDARQKETPVRSLNDHRTSGITFARIETSSPPSSTDKNVRYVLDVTSCSVHCFTNRVIYHRNRNFLKNTRQRAIYKKKWIIQKYNSCKLKKKYEWYLRIIVPIRLRKPSYRRNSRLIEAHTRVLCSVEISPVRKTEVEQDRTRKFSDRIVDETPRSGLVFPDEDMVLFLLTNRARPNAAVDHSGGHWNVA